jgi:hypothetical protein
MAELESFLFKIDSQIQARGLEFTVMSWSSGLNLKINPKEAGIKLHHLQLSTHILSAHIRLPWPTKVSSLRLKLESKLCICSWTLRFIYIGIGDACILIIMTWSNWHVES